MEVICLEEDAFYNLVEEVVKRIKEKNKISHDIWISAEEAMKILRITSKTTLANLRSKGKIKYSPVTAKLFLYDRQSILDYIESKSENIF